MPDLTELITGQPKKSIFRRAWDTVSTPIWEGPTRAGQAISQGMESIPTMQQTGQGGLRDWLGWADASAKGFLQGATEAGGQVLSDMTSPLSLSMEALGGGGLKRLGSLTRLSKNAKRVGSVVDDIPDITRAGAEFTPIGSEAIENAARAGKIAEEARKVKDIARGADVKSPISARNAEELISPPKSGLPQIEDAYMPTSENAAGINLGSRATSVYKPETSKEMGRLMVEMLDEGPIKDAFSIAQQKYPRLMGHVSEVNIGPNPSAGFFENLKVAGSSGSKTSTLPGSSNLSTLRVNPGSYLNWSPSGLADTVGHELTHVAQRLRKGSLFSPKYDLAEKAFGYSKNPFEKAAEASGKKFSDFALRDY